MSFIFGGSTGVSYEDLQKRRKIAQGLMQREGMRQPQYALEGLAQGAGAVVGALLDRKAGKQEKKLRDDYNSQFAEMFGGGVTAGGGVTPAMSQYDAMAMHGGPTNAAAAATGAPIDFSVFEEKYNLPSGYLARTAQIESNMGRNMDNPNSSAGGPFQFIDSTARQYGLEDKYDWTQSTDAASRLAADNAAVLRRALGREPTAAELYLAHQQGAGGAAKLLANPNAPAVDIVGADAVRLNGGDTNMTASQFAGKWLNKFGGNTGAPSGGSGGGSTQRIAQILAMMENPMASDGQRAMLQTILQREMQAGDPAYQLDLQYKQAQLDALQNPEPDLTAVERGYERAKSEGFEGTFMDYQLTLKQAGQTNQPVPLGTKGQFVIADPTAPGGVRVMIAPGSELDLERQAAEASSDVAQENTERSGSIVMEDIDKALGIIEADPNWTTGFGAILQNVPRTQAKSLAGLLQTIKANVGFDRLQQMRDASVTGGALGAINKTEMDLLQSVLGNLDQSLNADDLARNLRRVNEVYLDIIHGKGNRPGETPSAESGNDYSTMNMDDLLRNSPTTEAEAKAWNKRFDALQGVQQ